ARRRRRRGAPLPARADDARRPPGRAPGTGRGGGGSRRCRRRSRGARGRRARGAAERPRTRGGGRDPRRRHAPAQRRQGGAGARPAPEVSPDMARTTASATRAPHARYTPAGMAGVGRLERARSDKLHASDDQAVDDLDRAVMLARRDAKARAIVVGGRGRAFCAGIDLSALAGDRLGADWFRRWDVALAKLEAIPVPTVAAIQGPCLGGGLQIALCCDLSVASEDATFGLSPVPHGL